MAKASVTDSTSMAEKHAAAGENLAAAQAFWRSAEQTPSQPQLWIRAADMYGKCGNQLKEIDCWVRAARGLFETDDFKKSLLIAKRVLAKDPNNKPIKRFLAIDFEVAIISGEISDAIQTELEDIQRSAHINPDDYSQMDSLTPDDVIDDKNIELIHHVREIPLFSKLTDHEIVPLLDMIEVIHVKRGQIIVSQGEYGDCFFAILSGQSSVFQTASDGTQQEIAKLKSGDFFGELSFFFHQTRTTSITADTDMGMLRFDKQALEQLEDSIPTIFALIKQFGIRRAANSVFESNKTMRTVKKAERRIIADNLDLINVPKGTTLITQGEKADGIYFVARGNVSAKSKFRGGKVARYPDVKAGHFFGEISFIKNGKASATCETTENCDLLKLPRSRFGMVLHDCPDLVAVMKQIAAKRMKRSQEFAEAQRAG